MKVLVTGATGFIGNHVIQKLLKNNDEIIATSLNQVKARSFPWFKYVHYLALDLSNLDYSNNYYNFFNQPDIIIHLAWEGLPNYNSLFHIEQNLSRHSFFIKNLVVNGAKDITVAGTCLEYGLKEGKLDEELPSEPANPYAIAKDTLRKNLEQLQQHTHFDLKWMRLFYMYGKGQNPNALFSQLEKALEKNNREFNMSKGDQQRDYLPVEIAAEYIVSIAKQRKINGIINCCSGVPITINDLVEKFLKEKGKTIKLNKGYYPYPEYEPLNFWGDNRKLKNIIG